MHCFRFKIKQNWLPLIFFYHALHGCPLVNEILCNKNDLWHLPSKWSRDNWVGSCWWIILYLRTRAFISFIDKTAAAWNVKNKKKILTALFFKGRKNWSQRESNQNKHLTLYLKRPSVFPPPLSRSWFCVKVSQGGGSASVRIHNVPLPAQSMFNLGPFKLIWSAFPLTYLQ